MKGLGHLHDRWLRYGRGMGLGVGLIYLAVLVLTPPEVVRPGGYPRLIAGTMALFVLAALSWRTLIRRRTERIRTHVMERMGEHDEAV